MILDGRDRFYQWDLDRKLIVTDESIDEVHFCNRTDDCSLVCEVYQEGELRLVDVPNILLQKDWRINVYAFDGSYTKVHEVYEVERRTKPADYIYTETEIKNYDDLAARVAQIEENGISDEAVESAVERYLDEHDIKVDLDGYATETYVDEKIEQIELTPGPAGKDGAPGKDGKDGSDYVLTEADKKEIAGMVEVTGGGDIDLTGYATEDYVDSKAKQTVVQYCAERQYVDHTSMQNYKSEVQEAINNIQLTPGPEGPAGKDGEDYALTDEDKAEIAGMVEVTGGGEVSVDGKTIVKDANGALKTSAYIKAGAGADSVVIGLGNISESKASGMRAFATNGGSAHGGYSIAMGVNSTAANTNSVAIGYYARANADKQTVIGRNNTQDSTATFIIGNGTSSSDTRNAMTVDGDNQVHFPGTVVVGENKEEVATKAYVDAHAGSGGGGSGDAIQEIYVGSEAPTDPNIKLWIDTDKPNPFLKNTDIDNETIVLDEYGKLQTTLGGGRALARPETLLGSFEGSTPAANEPGWGMLHFNNSNKTVTFESIAKDMNLDASGWNDGWTDLNLNIEYTVVHTDGTSYTKSYKNLTMNAEHRIYLPSDDNFYSQFMFDGYPAFVCRMDATELFNNYTLTSFKMTLPAEYAYQAIDAGFVPIDGSSIITKNGKLSTTITSIKDGTYGGLGSTNANNNDNYGLAWGYNNRTWEKEAVALGYNCKVDYCYGGAAIGYMAWAKNGSGAVALNQTTANCNNQLTCGQANIVDNDDKYYFLVGCGAGDWSPDNAFGVRKTGEAEFFKGFILQSPNGGLWKFTVDDNGQLQGQHM